MKKLLLLLCGLMLIPTFALAENVSDVPWHLSFGNLGGVKPVGGDFWGGYNWEQKTAVPQSWKGDLVIPSVIEGRTIRRIGEEDHGESTNRPFLDCKLITSITFPETVERIYPSAFQGCSSLSKFIVDPKNKHYKSENGFIFSKDGKRLELVPPGAQVIKVPNGTEMIADNVFDGCSNVRVLSLPQSLKSYTGRTFYNLEPEAVVSAYLPDNMSRKKLKKWIIPEGTQYIGFGDSWNWLKDAEDYLDRVRPLNLTSVKLPGGVRVIGPYAFKALTNLETIELPSSVVKIDKGAFTHCVGLTSMTLPSSVTTVGEDAFAGCSSLTSIVIPSSVTEIRERTFAFCESLTSIVIPEGVTSVGFSAFHGCECLTSVTILNSECKIAENAFDGVSPTKLVSSMIPSKMDTRNLVEWIIPEGTTKVVGLSDNPFPRPSNDTIKEVKIPSSVKEIAPRAFARFSALTSIVIPEGVTSIKAGTFSGCTGLTSITIPSSVTEIGAGAFSGCTGLTSITIPEGVTSIKSGAFEKCSSLTSVTIPSTVKSIGCGAFYECNSLSSVSVLNEACAFEEPGIRDPFEELGVDAIWSSGVSRYAFDGVSPTKLVSSMIPSKMDTRNLVEWIIPEGTTKVVGLSDNPFSRPSNDTIKEVKIPSSVKEIAPRAFARFSALTSIVIPEGVTSIGYNAFEECTGLTSITLPEGLSKIGKCAFAECSNLRGTLLIPATVQEIGPAAFADCSSLSEFVFCGPPPKVERSPFVEPFAPTCNAKGVYMPRHAREWRKVLANGQWHGIQMSMKGMWLVYLLIVLFVGGAGAGGFFFYKKRKMSKSAA